MRRTLTVLTALAATAGLTLTLTGTAHATDASKKPSGSEFAAAAYALDRVEDAVLLGRPLPPHDPALGSSKARLTITVAGYNPDNWGDRVSRIAPFIINTRGLASGPLTVWAKAGGHMCAPGSESKWMKWTGFRSGRAIEFPVQDKSYDTYVFFRVTDREGTTRWGHSRVRVTPYN